MGGAGAALAFLLVMLYLKYYAVLCDFLSIAGWGGDLPCP